jgi:hypothetical protein
MEHLFRFSIPKELMKLSILSTLAFFFFFSFGYAGVCNQGFALASQVSSKGFLPSKLPILVPPHISTVLL